MFSIILAVDVMVALAAIYVRSDGLTARWDRERVVAGAIEAPSPLSAGNFSARRTPRSRTSPAATPETTTTTASFVVPPLPASPTTVATAAPEPVKRPTGRRSQERTRRSTATTAKPAAPTAKPGATPAKPAVTTTRPAAAAATPAAARKPGSLSDPAGDTFVADTDEALAESRADIVRAAATREAAGITFTMQVHQPTDPRQDERWGGNSTYARWSLDSNNDTLPDFEVHYFRVDDENVGGYVAAPGPDSPALCGLASASYGPDGYKATVDPACLGNPTSFTYRATMSYDTDPGDESAAIANDVAPNKGWSSAVTAKP